MQQLHCFIRSQILLVIRAIRICSLKKVVTLSLVKIKRHASLSFENSIQILGVLVKSRNLELCSVRLFKFDYRKKFFLTGPSLLCARSAVFLELYYPKSQRQRLPWRRPLSSVHYSKLARDVISLICDLVMLQSLFRVELARKIMI